MAAASRVHRFQALQDVLDALVMTEASTEKAAEGILVPISVSAAPPATSEVALAALSALLPDNVVQQALHIVDTARISCVSSSRGRRAYEVRGQKFSHLVLPSGLYCSCPYFGRRVLEAGELCCKHWLAVQVALRCETGISSSSTLGEDEFLEWTRQRMVGCATPF
eukprot:TRINITY_DN36210_c0_g1_i1.p1 TRINITY_DN36210_c0_g1~~TRINITY_DN36210_c0_g1_i1.p1  ORF type:complete len:174 (-),score=29.67 TRINITY_DN36210_c0_g1_i1:62-559(-)